MKLGNDYWHSMDRETARKYNVNAGYIGISTPPFKDQLESLKTRIFQGASQVELGFTGKGKGSASQGSITPEQYGKEEREQLRLLSKINEVDLTTHATIGVGSLSGFDERRQGFDHESQEQNLQEIRRTIDFASDVTKGGPVVVHTGEFPRPIFKYKDEGFEGYKDEEEHAAIHLADIETGRVSSLKTDLKISVPQWQDEEKRIPKTENGKILFEERTYKQTREDFDNLDDEKKKKEYLNDPAIYFYKKYHEHELAQSKAESERYLRESERIKPQDEPYANSLKEIAIQYGQRADQLERSLNNIRPIEDVGVPRSAEALATAAVYAMKKEKAANLDKPLFIAPENIFPENGYGSHPEELKNLIIKSREAMAEKLWDSDNNQPKKDGRELKIYSQQDAQKAAEDHIKATFDIGHLTTWRKFFTGKPEEFDNWVGKQLDSLTKEKIIGHAHITDNFGYFDEHVTPGEGTVPIPGFIKKLRESGYGGKFIIEPGSQDVKAWTGALRSLNSPVYRINGSSRSWTEVEGGYFSKTSSPSYLVGAYTPGASLGDEYNDWRFWTRLPIE